MGGVITDPRPGEWYPLDKYMAAFYGIAVKTGNAALHQIGKRIPENAAFPPHMHSFVTAMSSLDVAYHMNHRKNGQIMANPATGEMVEGIGHYRYVPPASGARQAKMICDNLYPCDFDRGILTALSQRFRPPDAIRVRVEHAPAGPCRKKGDASCTYLLTW
ncbi:MAG TPA: hypothetical protein VD902_12910 [Symbiobacteriaceae bacterium]|nr:hypothetical protein [Symbiobacteriaceae bacterium]